MGSEWANNFPRFIVEMLKSIFTGDIYILIAAVITGVLIPKICSVRTTIISKLDRMPNNPDWAREVRGKLNWWYTLFLTLISIFPLLGMFGTVAALLNLDFSDMAGNLDSVKTDFFHALTSTAWGIVFSVVFKIINSALFFDIEDIYNDIDEIVKALKPGERRRYESVKPVKLAKDDDVLNELESYGSSEDYDDED